MGIKKFFLLGHSTGCQDIVHLLRLGNLSPALSEMIAGIVLQGPVSDREAILANCEASSEIDELLRRTHDFVSTASPGQTEFLPRDAGKVLFDENYPLTVQRFVSLTTPGSQEDMFSSDLTDEMMKSNFSSVNVPALLVISLKEEYYPKKVKPRLIGEKLRRNFLDATLSFIDADHSLTGKEEEMTRVVREFITTIRL